MGFGLLFFPRAPAVLFAVFPSLLFLVLVFWPLSFWVSSLSFLNGFFGWLSSAFYLPAGGFGCCAGAWVVLLQGLLPEPRIQQAWDKCTVM